MNLGQPESCIAPLVGDKCPSKVAKGTCEAGKQQSVSSSDLVREHPEDEAARQQPDHEEGVDRRGPDVLAAVLKKKNKDGGNCMFRSNLTMLFSVATDESISKGAKVYSALSGHFTTLSLLNWQVFPSAPNDGS